MKPVLIDTDILSMFFRGNLNVVANFQVYLTLYPRLNISLVTYYEVLSGLKHRDAQKQLSAFQEFSAQNSVLPLTKQSVRTSADLYATLRTQGTPIDDIDLLIAGVAISNSLVLVSHNQRHFSRIKGLDFQDWSQA